MSSDRDNGNYCMYRYGAVSVKATVTLVYAISLAVRVLTGTHGLSFFESKATPPIEEAY